MVSALLGEGCPGGVLTCSIFLLSINVFVSPKLKGGPLSLFCQTGFLNVPYVSSRMEITDLALIDCTNLATG